MCNCHWGGCVWAKIGKVLLVVGGLNWGLVGMGMLLGSMSNWNVVDMVLGSMPKVLALVYVLVGISAVVKIFGCKCKQCKSACASCATCQVGGGEQKM